MGTEETRKYSNQCGSGSGWLQIYIVCFTWHGKGVKSNKHTYSAPYVPGNVEDSIRVHITLSKR